MKIDLTKRIYAFGDTIISKPDGNPFILKDACIESLLNEQVISQNEKLERYNLALKINNEENIINLTSEEVSIIKESINKNYGTLIFAQCYKILEGE